MSTHVDADNAATQEAQTEARAIARCVRGCATDDQYIELVERIATALAAKDAELAETVNALWRIPPNMHTIPCEANGFAEPDPFEGVGETYANAYTREKSRAERAEARIAELEAENGRLQTLVDVGEDRIRNLRLEAEAQLAEAGKALETFADIADLIDASNRRFEP